MLRTYEACCQPLLDDNTVRRSFVSNGRCFECISKYSSCMPALYYSYYTQYDIVFLSYRATSFLAICSTTSIILIIFAVIGLDQPMYTLNESSTVYMRRLRLLAPTGYTWFARPRLRLNGISGTAGGERRYHSYIHECVVFLLIQLMTSHW